VPRVDYLVGDQLVLGVEEQDAELFARLVTQGLAHIGQERRPGRDHRAAFYVFGPDPQAELLHGHDVDGADLAHVQRAPLSIADHHTAGLLLAGGQDSAQRAEPGE
jgi:hypothetical protein